MSAKEEFLDICREKIHRDGIDELLKWLENETDFFEAPASTRFHGSFQGGLLQHSLNVYYALEDYVNRIVGAQVSDETFAIVALFHDLCKANYYTVSMRNVKDENTGVWNKVPYYTVNDQYPIGHGEKSVIELMKFMKLTDDEIYAIRWHMGGFDSAVKGGDPASGKAFEICPLAVLLHLADMTATYLCGES